MQNPSCDSFQQTTTVCFGLLDCHKLFLAVLKTSIPKSNPRQITYRDYKKFDSLKLKDGLKIVLTIENIGYCT